MRFQTFSDLRDAFHTNPYGHNLSIFRQLMSFWKTQDEQVRVLFTANDGNDYAIVEITNGNTEFWFIGITNSVDDKVGDLIAFSKHDSYREALAEMSNMSATDLDM